MSIKGYRASIGYTQKQMADALDMSVVTYQTRESGKGWTIEEAKKLQAELSRNNINVTLDELFKEV